VERCRFGGRDRARSRADEAMYNGMFGGLGVAEIGGAA